jgi:hypothetical protein
MLDGGKRRAEAGAGRVVRTMPIQIRCEHCGQVLYIPDQYAGQVGRCHACGGEVSAPARSAADASPDAGGEPRSGAAPDARGPSDAGGGAAGVDALSARARHAAALAALEGEGSTLVAALLGAAAQARIGEEHARPLASVLGLPEAEARRMAVEGAGIVARSLDHDSARRVIAGLADLGLEAAIVAAHRLVEPPPPTPVAALTWDAHTVIATLAGGLRALEVPKRSIRAANRGLIGERALGHEPAPANGGRTALGRVRSGLLGGGGDREASARPTGRVLVVDLVADDPPVRLRLRSDTLDLSALDDADPADREDALRRLLACVLPGCAKLRLNMPREGGGEREDPGRGPLAAFDRRTEWLYNLALASEAE